MSHPTAGKSIAAVDTGDHEHWSSRNFAHAARLYRTRSAPSAPPVFLSWCQYCDDIRVSSVMRFTEDARYICTFCLAGGSP